MFCLFVCLYKSIYTIDRPKTLCKINIHAHILHIGCSKVSGQRCIADKFIIFFWFNV